MSKVCVWLGWGGGGSRGISLCVCGWVTLLILSNFLVNIPLFHFPMIFKNGGDDGGSLESPEPPLDLPLIGMQKLVVSNWERI